VLAVIHVLDLIVSIFGARLFSFVLQADSNIALYLCFKDNETAGINMIRRIILIAITLLLGVTLTTTTGIQSARATVQEFHLYGSYASGWGFSSTTMNSPGPTITVAIDDVVNLTLTNEDTGIYAPNHQFLLSYHNSSVAQADDLVSPTIGPGQTIVFTFVANVSGTFTYYCMIHPNPMYGTFVITPAVPEFPSLIILSCFMTAILVTVALYNTKIRKQLS
jgi:FtsP/CotA-like multicopper oxidase with cupredoxin domain